MFQIIVHAQEAASVIQQMPDSAPSLPVGDFLSQVFEVVKNLGGLSWGAKIIALITLAISSLKVSALEEKVWDKLGAAKVLVAPVLGLIVGLISLPSLSGPAVIAYLMAGAGSIILHQILKAIQDMPFVGAKIKIGIYFISKLLGGKTA